MYINEEIKKIVEAHIKKDEDMSVYMAMLMIGYEKISINYASKLLNLTENEIIKKLNEFNIGYASI